MFTKKFILQLSLSISVQESHLKIELKKPEVGYEEIAASKCLFLILKKKFISDDDNNGSWDTIKTFL